MIPTTQASLGAAGAGAGLGLGRLLQEVFDVLNGPRREIWSQLGLGENGDELMGKLGLDVENPLVKALGMGSEMALDPVNLLTMGTGGAAGKVAGGAVEHMAARAAAKAGVQNEIAALAKLGSVADAGAAAQQASKSTLLQKLENFIPSHADVTYKPSVLDELPGLSSLTKTPVEYSRVDPRLAQQINDMGIGAALPGGRVQVLQKPSFAKGRGGVLKPINESMPSPMGDVLSNTDIPLAGGGGPEDWLTPAFKSDAEYAALQRGIGEPMPSLASHLADAGDLKGFGNLPLDQVSPAARAQQSQLEQQLRELLDQPLSRIEQLVGRYMGG